MPAGDTMWEGKVPLALGMIESETQKDKQTNKQANKQNWKACHSSEKVISIGLIGVIK